MARLHRLTLFAAAVLLSLPAVAVGSLPAAALNCGILPYTEAALHRRAQSTESREFVNVVGSTLRFRTRETTCIVVQFSAQISAAGDGSVVQVRSVRNDGKEDVVNVDGRRARGMMTRMTGEKKCPVHPGSAAARWRPVSCSRQVRRPRPNSVR